MKLMEMNEFNSQRVYPSFYRSNETYMEALNLVIVLKLGNGILLPTLEENK